VTSYAWDFGDANTAQTTTSSTTHLYAAVGSYNASVKVIDSLGRSATSLAVAVVSAVPVPPSPAPPPPPSYTVVLTASPTTVVIGASSTLTAMVTLLNGAPAPTSYAWDCDGNGTTDFTTAININTQPCAYPLAGTITSKVTVTGGSVTGTASTSVTVTAPPLFVAISPSTSTPTVGVNLDFTATVTSVGPLPALMQWQWDDTNDGTFDVVVPSAANGNVRTTNYGATGAVTIKVLVTDVATGRTAIGTRTVTVQ
jgi:PKD repeat protein